MLVNKHHRGRKSRVLPTFIRSKAVPDGYGASFRAQYLLVQLRTATQFFSLRRESTDDDSFESDCTGPSVTSFELYQLPSQERVQVRTLRLHPTPNGVTVCVKRISLSSALCATPTAVVTVVSLFKYERPVTSPQVA